jgi:hypothetical protein
MNAERECALRAKIAIPEVQTTNLERKEMMNEHNSVAKLRKPASDRDV